MGLPVTFGKYFLTEKIATGGMAEIYRGKLFGPGGFEKQLVIKQISPGLAQRREFVDMFVAEAKTTVSLTHGNIVPVYELGVVDGTYFIAMEYVDGPTLSDLMHAADGRGRRIGAGAAAYICAEVLKGLSYAHRKGPGVIHRDLSARNVIVSREGEVKIVDFGLAATLETAAEASAASSGNGRPVGSFPYMSPEQARREPLDPRTDIFTCGILLWEMLVGASLFTRGDEDTTIAAVLGDAIPRPSQRAPGVPAELEAVCMLALERDRERRWPTADAFLGALGKYLYALDPAVTSASISALVSELCPDVPRGPAERPASRPEGSRPGLATTPMERPAKEQILATHVEFEKILTRATGAVPVLRKPIGVAAPERGGSARWVILVLLLAAAGIGAGVWATRRGPPGDRPTTGPSPPPARPDAAALAASPADAAAAAVPAAPDAGPARPVGKGRLVIGIEGAASADVYVDGRRVGSAPFAGEVPAGRRRVKVVCVPDVCPPRGAERSESLDVPAGGELRHVFSL
jgi:serine/threonine-protein kinase